MWYVVHCKPGEEQKALENLQKQGFECFLPTLKQEKLVRGQVTSVIKPLFSRYLFVQTQSQNQNFSVIKSTKGVHRLVSFGPLPSQVSDTLIETIRSLASLLGSEINDSRSLIRSGDEVMLIDGPLKGIKGIFHESSGTKRAFVLIYLLHKQHTIQVDKSDIVPSPSWSA
jgi:transcriptional antiterminator RfaH